MQPKTQQSVLYTANMGYLGTGFPYAIGAKIAKPERQVYCVTGDSAFGFNIQELETAARLNLPVIVIVGIVAGVFTPTEAGAVAVVYALTVATTIYRELSDAPSLYSGSYGIGSRDLQPEGLIAAIENMLPEGPNKRLLSSQR